MTLPTIKAVTFDMDGLMFNTEDLYDIVGEQLLGRRGLEFTTELKMRMMGLPGPEAFAVMKDYCGIDEPIETLAQECDVLFETLLPEKIQTMPGLEQLLDLLESRQIPKGIATSSHRRMATRALGSFDLEPRFDFVLTAESVTRGKPDPEVYLTAAKKHGVEPAQMLVLEDSIHGSNAGVAAGATTIAVPSRRVDSGQFGSVYAICESLADEAILELIRN